MYQPPPNQSQQFLPPGKPPDHTRRNAWIIIIAIVLVGFLIIGALQPASATQTAPLPTATPTQAAVLATTPIPTATPSPTPQPTATPTPKPTQSTGISATHGTPRLGSPVSDFVGKYGQPDTTCATCEKGIYNFQRIQGTQIDYISTMLTDANGHVNGFDVQSLSSTEWPTSTAYAICESFGPSDVNYDHPLQVLQSSDGSSVEKVYKSVWLGEQLQASDFQDGNTTNNNTDLSPGTFDISYVHPSSPSTVSDCSLEAGIQQV